MVLFKKEDKMANKLWIHPLKFGCLLTWICSVMSDSTCKLNTQGAAEFFPEAEYEELTVTRHCIQLFDSEASYLTPPGEGVGRGYVCTIKTSCPNTTVSLGPRITCPGHWANLNTTAAILNRNPDCTAAACASKLVLAAQSAHITQEIRISSDLNRTYAFDEFLSLNVSYQLCGTERIGFIIRIQTTAPLNITCSYSSETSLPEYGCPGNEATTMPNTVLAETTTYDGGRKSEATLHARNTWPLPVSKKNTIIIACVVVAILVIIIVIVTTVVCRRMARRRTQEDLICVMHSVDDEKASFSTDPSTHSVPKNVAEVHTDSPEAGNNDIGRQNSKQSIKKKSTETETAKTETDIGRQSSKKASKKKPKDAAEGENGTGKEKEKQQLKAPTEAVYSEVRNVSRDLAAGALPPPPPEWQHQQQTGEKETEKQEQKKGTKQSRTKEAPPANAVPMYEPPWDSQGTLSRLAATLSQKSQPLSDEKSVTSGGEKERKKKEGGKKTKGEDVEGPTYDQVSSEILAQQLPAGNTAEGDSDSDSKSESEESSVEGEDNPMYEGAGDEYASIDENAPQPGTLSGDQSSLTPRPGHTSWVNTMEYSSIGEVTALSPIQKAALTQAPPLGPRPQEKLAAQVAAAQKQKQEEAKLEPSPNPRESMAYASIDETSSPNDSSGNTLAAPETGNANQLGSGNPATKQKAKREPENLDRPNKKTAHKVDGKQEPVQKVEDKDDTTQNDEKVAVDKPQSAKEDKSQPEPTKLSELDSTKSQETSDVKTEKELAQKTEAQSIRTSQIAVAL